MLARRLAPCLAVALAIGTFATLPTAHAAMSASAPVSRAKHAASAKARVNHTHLPHAVEQTLQWIRSSGDNHGSSFIIIDKTQAHAYVFEANGSLRAHAPVLLGLAKGDDNVPGIGDKKLADIKPGERTTPAGRFIAEPGVNAHGVDVVWVDYDAAISMHRVLTNNPTERRLQRLLSKTPADNRISYGCINLPVWFYEKVVSPTANAGETIVYVLPETRPASVVFGFSDRGTALARKGGSPGLARPDTMLLKQLDGA